MENQVSNEMTTEQEVMVYYNRAKTDSKAWHEKIQKWRNLYNFNHYDNAANEGEQRYEDPTYTNTVDLAVGIILGHDMEFKAQGWSPSTKEQEDSSHIEKFLGGLLQVAGDEEEIHIPYEVILNFVRDGAGVLYTIWDDVLAARYATTIEIPLPDNGGMVAMEGYKLPPLRVQVIDPLKILVIQGGVKRWKHVIRTERMTVAEVEEQYNVTIERYRQLSMKDKMVTSGELIDYWRTEDIEEDTLDEFGMPTGGNVSRRVVKHAIVFEGTAVQQLEIADKYDDVPFDIGFFKPVDRSRAQDWGHSILKPLESTVPLIESVFNRRQRMINVISSLPIYMKMQGNRTSPKVDNVFGKVVRLTPDEDIGFVNFPGSPPDIDDQLEFLRSRVQQSGFSDVMFGSGASSVSGYALSQLGDQNRIRLEQPVKHLQAFWSRWAKKVLNILAKNAENKVVRVYGQLNGRDFMNQIFVSGLENYSVRCQIKPDFPNERVRNHAMATQVRGLLSEETIMQEYLNIDQPNDEKMKRLIELAENDPMVRQFELLKLYEEWAQDPGEDPQSMYRKKAAALMLNNFAMQGGQMRQPSLPGGGPSGGGEMAPPNMEQLTGLQSPTGEPPPQAAGGVPPGQDIMNEMAGMEGAAPMMSGEIGGM